MSRSCNDGRLLGNSVLIYRRHLGKVPPHGKARVSDSVTYNPGISYPHHLLIMLLAKNVVVVVWLGSRRMSAASCMVVPVSLCKQVSNVGHASRRQKVSPLRAGALMGREL